jgi:hypothetical protein
MRAVKLIFVVVFCSSVAFAETTLDLLKQRADAGDAAAQTFLGMAYHYGYGVASDQDAALKWFSRAADQGDAFAAKRRDDSAGLRFVSPDKLQKKIEQASSASYEGHVSFGELVSNRELYTGKAVELDFTALPISGGTPNGAPYIYIREPLADSAAAVDRLYLCGESASAWKLELDKKTYGSSSTAYVLVEKDGLIALGTRQRQTDTGYEYKW